VFSGHYDPFRLVHREGEQHDATDSIYNGANDAAEYNSRNHVG
jgi:hypothetical protein